MLRGAFLRAVGYGLRSAWYHYSQDRLINRFWGQEYKILETYIDVDGQEKPKRSQFSGGVNMDIELSDLARGTSHERLNATLNLLAQKPEAVNWFLQDLATNQNRFISFLGTITSDPRIAANLTAEPFERFIRANLQTLTVSRGGSSTTITHDESFQHLPEVIEIMAKCGQLDKIKSLILDRFQRLFEGGESLNFNILKQIEPHAPDLLKDILRQEVTRIAQSIVPPEGEARSDSLPAFGSLSIFLANVQRDPGQASEADTVEVNSLYRLVTRSEVDFSDVITSEQVRTIGQYLAADQRWQEFAIFVNTVAAIDENLVEHFNAEDITSALSAIQNRKDDVAEIFDTEVSRVEQEGKLDDPEERRKLIRLLIQHDSIESLQMDLQSSALKHPGLARVVLLAARQGYRPPGSRPS